MSSKTFVELYFDPGTRNIGEAIVSFRATANKNTDIHYHTEFVKHVDCIGDATNADTGAILKNLSNYLKTDANIEKFMELANDPTKYDIEVAIEQQEGITKGPGGFNLAVAMIKMGTVSGAIFEFFSSKNIPVVFVSKKAKWMYSEKELEKYKPKKREQSNKVIGIKKRNYHKINTKRIVLDILKRQKTTKSNQILKWMQKNKSKAQHVQDSILGAMHRIKNRID